MPCRMNSTARKAPQTLMFASPRPVEPAAPTSLSQYCPAPMIGESPTRPGIFHERPLVVVTDAMSPVAVTAFMLIVPYVRATPDASRYTWTPDSCSSDEGRLLPPGAAGVGGGSTGSNQLSDGLSLAFQRSQSRRLCSVSRFWVLKPISTANFRAPAPTSMMWSVWSMIALATAAASATSSRQ